MTKLMKLFFVLTAMLFGSLGVAKQHIVEQKDKQFSMPEIEIKVGDEIKFLNNDTANHHLMYKVGGKKFSFKQAKDKPEESAIIQKFVESEELTVRCAIHPKMKLKVKVIK